LDPYRVVNFVRTFHRWAELITADPLISLVIELWASGHSEREIEAALHRSDTWVHVKLKQIREAY
jgi:hypothetical protein